MDKEYIIRRISAILNEVAPDSLRLLYGSQARGDACPDSDFDILVVLPDDNTQGIFTKRNFEISDKLYDIELETGANISPLIVPKFYWERMKTPFSINVLNEGIPI